MPQQYLRVSVLPCIRVMSVIRRDLTRVVNRYKLEAIKFFTNHLYLPIVKVLKKQKKSGKKETEKCRSLVSIETNKRLFLNAGFTSTSLTLSFCDVTGP